ncbi:MAG: hypothetical protein D6814_03125 [Calditrichaeota bacterium]|nr:MAG: hypothetical protein D6814_03125 [Calditrichota bacterium]
MKFLVDQCVSYRTIKFLRSLGFKLTKLRDVDLPSLSDPDVLKLAIKRDEILLTEDNGFGNIL